MSLIGKKDDKSKGKSDLEQEQDTEQQHAAQDKARQAKGGDQGKGQQAQQEGTAKSLIDAQNNPDTYKTPVTITNDDGTTEQDVQQDVPTSENPDVPNTDRPEGTPGGPRDMSLNYSPRDADDEEAAAAREGTPLSENPDVPNTEHAEGEPGGPRDMGKNYSPS